jgi:hypothetical protein
MLLLPSDILALLAHFAPLFSRRTWRHVHGEESTTHRSRHGRIAR